EPELPKRRIIESYLNVVEWGDGVWGAEAAARTYFGRSAADLTASEAALLAGALINPRVHSPARPNARLRARQRLILARMGANAAPDRPRVDEDAPPPAAEPSVLPAPGPMIGLPAQPAR